MGGWVENTSLSVVVILGMAGGLVDLYKSVQIINLFTARPTDAMDRSHAYQLSSTNTVLLLTMKDVLATIKTQ